jgi:hypothetical protein
MDIQADEKVFCYSGNEYPDRPVSILLDGNRFEISRIIARWRTPEGRFFRVVAADDRVFDLHYFEVGDAWKIEQR